MEIIIKEDENGSKLSVAVINKRICISIYDSQVGMTIPLSSEDIINLTGSINFLLTNLMVIT